MQFRITFRQINITLIALLTACFTGFACGGPAAGPSAVSRTRSTFEADRPHDDRPLTESELSGNSRQPQRQASSATATSPPAPASSQTVRGYRIQVHSLKDQHTAEAARSQLRGEFRNLDAIIHIKHDPPYYKVRVGDFRSRAEASRILKLLQSHKDYRDAWIVEAMVTP